MLQYRKHQLQLEYEAGVAGHSIVVAAGSTADHRSSIILNSDHL